MTETQVDSTEERSGKLNNFFRRFGLYSIPIVIGLISTIGSLILLIVGAIYYKLNPYHDIANILFAAVTILFFGGIIILLFGYIPNIIDEKSTGRASLVKLEKFKNIDLTNNRNMSKFTRLYYSLVSENPQALANYMVENLDFYRNSPQISSQGLDQMLYTLAQKLGYRNSNAMISVSRGEKPKEMVIIEESLTDIDLRIPITKVYYIEKIPANEKSMISGLPIDIKKNVIVACPICGNMVERDLLEKWLTENKKCPVCKHIIKFEDYPFVKIDD